MYLTVNMNVCSCFQNTNNFNSRIHYVSGPCLWLDRHLQAWLPGLHDQRTGRTWGPSSRRSPRSEGCIKLGPSTTTRTAKRKTDSRKHFLLIVIVIFLHVLWNVKWSIFFASHGQTRSNFSSSSILLPLWRKLNHHMPSKLCSFIKTVGIQIMYIWIPETIGYHKFYCPFFKWSIIWIPDTMV